ncbi:hypothetical protein FRZ40_39660 [Paraburkholderia azotifigens]|uniref:Uncharacterized protein n=1 Tax=Paraburkholderia azotifigens TaxID=2057004 RepID=A0A5C6V5I9_9BURK|nr:hypothetical protein FRZ40_39660 [Paraburkholderia azotifigens]
MQRRRGTRIQSDLCVLTPVRRIRGGWWDSLGLWRWLGIGASIAALSLLAVNLVVLREVQQSVRAVVQHGHLVARIARNDGVAYWTATIGIKHASLVIVPAVVP